MKRSGKRWLGWLAGGTMLAATSCSTDMRDAVMAGALDYITGTTSGLIGALVAIDDQLAAAQETDAAAAE
jgi:hypothetical protein